MTAADQADILRAALKKEIMLQVNQRLFDTGMISEQLYRQAKIKIVDGA